jgi:hypothetical protein
MKMIKLTIIALIFAFSFQAANAQLRVGVHIGTPPPRHRVVVVERPYHRHYHHRRVVVVERPYRRY